LKIGGIIDISTVDIPHRSSMVIFTVGCNFKCDFCHNKYLLQPNVGREYKITDIVEKVKTNELVSGVSISGGEPTLQNDLLEVCSAIQEIGKYLSIDTNGSNPEVIRRIIPYINRIALDLKGPLIPEILEKITRVSVDLGKIVETIHILNNHKNLDFEIRTTYVESLLNASDFDKILQYLRRVRFTGNFVLQQYQFSEGVGEDFKMIFSKPEHDSLVSLVEPYKNLELPFNIYLRDEIVGYCSINDL
jgi:pyruvate formate lyase activating enzyme